MSVDTRRALAVPSRAALLDLLRAGAAPMTAAALAEAVGLHVNTVREHLDTLARAGLVARGTASTGGRGRPHTLYRAVAHSDMHDQLTRALLTGFGRAVDSPAAAAERAGAALTPDEPDGDGADVDQLTALVAHFDRLGFDPVVEGDELRLRRCPVRELAAEHTDVVCGVHLGLARGVLERVGGDLTVEELVPFAAPGHCLLRLGRSARSVPAPAAP